MATQIQLAKMRLASKAQRCVLSGSSVQPRVPPLFVVATLCTPLGATFSPQDKSLLCWPHSVRSHPTFFNPLSSHPPSPPSSVSPEEELARKNAQAFLDGCSVGDTNKVEDLLGKKVSVDTCDAAGTTGLCLAAKGGHMDTLTLLLKAGASADAVAGGARSALSWASDAGRLEVVQALIAAKPALKINQVDSFGFTPLLEAVRSGHLPMVAYLLSIGADIHATTKTLSSCLTLATEKNNLPMVQLLLKQGAKLDHKTEAGHTAIALARMAGFLPLVRVCVCVMGWGGVVTHAHTQYLTHFTSLTPTPITFTPPPPARSPSSWGAGNHLPPLLLRHPKPFPPTQPPPLFNNTIAYIL